MKIKELKKEFKVLTKNELKSINGGGFAYGDGKCRAYWGAPVLYNTTPGSHYC